LTRSREGYGLRSCAYTLSLLSRRKLWPAPHLDFRTAELLEGYAEPARGWACYSAKCWRGDRPNGGDIYDFAGQLWGLMDNRDFPEVRRRLYASFLGIEPPEGRGRTGAP
jgi:hypothetical protein